MICNLDSVNDTFVYIYILLDTCREAKTMLVLIIYTLGFLLYQDSFFPRMMIYVLEHLSAYGKWVELKRYVICDFPVSSKLIILFRFNN